MEELKDLFYDGNGNLLFANIKDKNGPFEYVYIHNEDKDGANFITYFESGESNKPLLTFKLEKLVLDDAILSCDAKKLKDNNTDKLFPLNNVFNDDKNWKRIRINGFLPNVWLNYFKKIRNYIIKEKE